MAKVAKLRTLGRKLLSEREIHPELQAPSQGGWVKKKRGNRGTGWGGEQGEDQPALQESF